MLQVTSWNIVREFYICIDKLDKHSNQYVLYIHRHIVFVSACPK